MKLTPTERRERIMTLVKEDSDYCRIHSETASAEIHFAALTDALPEMLRTRLWNYPGSLYFMHHRILTLICQNMKFMDEE